jgi:hypothetical protein
MDDYHSVGGTGTPGDGDGTVENALYNILD